MTNQCGTCKHGHDKNAGGMKVSPGTVWCGQRSLQMGKMRQMPCFVAAAGTRCRHCIDCKRARMLINMGICGVRIALLQSKRSFKLCKFAILTR